MSAEFDPTVERIQPSTLVPLKLEDIVLALGMAAMALITAANVVTRYFTDISLAFTEEYSVFLMVVVALVGTASAVATGRHIRIDYFVSLMSAPAQRRCEIAGLLITVATFLIVAVYGTWLVYDEWRFDILTSGMGQPQWLFTGILPLFAIAILLRATGRILRLWREAR